MPKIFRPRDIEKMKASDVTQEFVEYFNRLSDIRKKEFTENRPDLYSAVLAWKNSEDVESTEEITEEIPAENIESEENDVKTDDEEDDSQLLAIQNNIYANKDIPKLMSFKSWPIEALTITNPSKCPVHRTALVKYTPKFYKPNGEVMGVNFFHCKECRRLFVTKAEFGNSKMNLENWGIPYRFYDYDVSMRYLKTQMKPYKLGRTEKIYWVDPWIEDNPKCPVHNCALEELPCELTYQNNSLRFDAYYCSECKKVILRKTKASQLEDQCAQIGIPSDRFEQLAAGYKPKTQVVNKAVQPDYYIDEGKRVEYTDGPIKKYDNLTEDDTVVISDSIYCSLDDHETATLLCLIWVRDKYDGKRRAYMVMLGYCAECNKYYMDEMDYGAIYKIGRPEVKIIVDSDDNPYMITSGSVFNSERDNLNAMEKRIEHEIKDIHSKPDYVSQYETVSYNDDGELRNSKEKSKRKYEGRLEQLAGYKAQPYEYHVEITANGEKDKYYIGYSDIFFGNEKAVLAINSPMGRNLVNYRTTNVEKDGKVYRISLSRQLDIKEGFLFGYTNIRTDEDVIFRKGVTDPFLVRVLNMRRRQHELIDIFVTIQENQNTIVDADFSNNIIVQGCAGSGKTMVLLHRLASLNYTERNFDFSRDALILTPNDHFTLHISGLAASMQIDSISRISVERYYANTLESFSPDLKPTGVINSEMNVQQNFVDYIYSDTFMNDFETSYAEVIAARNQLIPRVTEVMESMNLNLGETDISDDSNVIPQLEKTLNALLARITANEAEIKKADEEFQEAQKKKQNLARSIQKRSAQASEFLRNAAQKAKTNALGLLTESTKSIDAAKIKLSELKKKKEEFVRRTDTKNENANISFDEYIALNQDLIDESVTEIIQTIRNTRSELNSAEQEKKRIGDLLKIPFDEIITLPGVEDDEITEVLTELSSLRAILDQQYRERERIEGGWRFGRARRLASISEKITETENLIETNQSLISELLAVREDELESAAESEEKLNSDLSVATAEAKNLIAENREKRLSKMSREINQLSRSIEADSSVLGEYVNVVYQLEDEMQDSEILKWFDRVSEFLPSEKTELGELDKMQLDIKASKKEYAGMDHIIEAAKAYYDDCVAKQYSDEIKQSINDLKAEVSKYSLLGTYQMIFDKAVHPFIEKNKIKAINGKNHRYDFYARLLFAMKYFGKVPGHLRFICVDEGQDLALNEYRIIRELNGRNVVFNIFGDTNQLMKPNRGIADWNSLNQMIGFRKYVLNENYRNTNQITRFCNDSFNMTMMQTGVDGPKVREITKAEFDQELANFHITDNRVAVLLPRSIQKRTYINMDLLSSEVSEAIAEEIESEKIALMYVDEVKGIEFDKVYVVPNHMGRNEKYIAYTRALNELILVID